VVNGVVSEKHGDSAKKKQRTRLRWALFVLLTPLSIFLCGQAAWMMRGPEDQVEVHSSLTADYSPWTTAFFPSLDPSILMAALRDRNEGGFSDARRAMNCFLLTSGCEIVRQMEIGVTATPVRIANNVEPDLTQPDGQGLMLQPGREIILDLGSTPILVTGSVEPAADLLIYIIQDLDQEDEIASLDVSVARNPDDPWIPVFVGGDQTHGDMELELPYSMDNQVFGQTQPPSTSSDDALNQEWISLALDVDTSVMEPGLYGWLRIGIKSEASEPVALDAVVVVTEAD
jgi:hypothetical protein